MIYFFYLLLNFVAFPSQPSPMANVEATQQDGPSSLTMVVNPSTNSRPNYFRIIASGVAATPASTPPLVVPSKRSGKLNLHDVAEVNGIRLPGRFTIFTVPPPSKFLVIAGNTTVKMGTARRLSMYSRNLAPHDDTYLVSRPIFCSCLC